MLWWMLMAHGATLELEVAGLTSTAGDVVAVLYDSSDGFPTKTKLAVATVTVPAGRAVRFEGLTPGRYAVSLFHDVDGDGKLDMWWFGPPKEGVASSNDAAGRMGPPSFDDAAIDIAADDVKQAVTMNYLFGK